tara:strand:+ start:449 stop:715 length:267 start_codon:yes stop_codon:yes gene_type:complete
MASRNQTNKIVKMSFEEALSELEDIIRGLESGETNLDDAIEAYERGTALKRHCDSKLRDAQEKISRIKLNDDGTVSEAISETETETGS